MNQQAEKLILKVFLFTDLVGSTDLKRRYGDVEGARMITHHNEIFRKCLRQYAGIEQDNAGDGFFATFDVPSHAVECALAFHRGLEEIESPEPLHSRVGIHMGQIVAMNERKEGFPEGSLFGLAVDTAARIMGLAQARQILMTQNAFDSVRQFVMQAPDGSPLEWLAHGPYSVKGVEGPVAVFEVGIPGFSPLRPPPDSEKAKRAVAPEDEEALGWRPALGQLIPRLPHWRLDRKIGEGGFGEAWLAVNEKSDVRHVFKFCFESDRLRALKREVALLRVLKASLGDRPDIAQPFDWQLDRAPYYLESEYAGEGDLSTWAQSQGGLARVPLTIRIGLVAQAAEALGGAHAAGVLHNDIKPSNILIARDAKGNPSIRLADFGVGLIINREILQRKGFTTVGFGPTNLQDGSSSGQGTQLYMAPERLAGEQPKTHSDVYALGIVLYQMVVGDLKRPLAHGWEREVTDELLREDIAACVDGLASNRLPSALDLAKRLRCLDERRAQRDHQRAEREEAERAKQAIAEERARRERQRFRVTVALMVFSFLGLCIALFTNWSTGNAVEDARDLVEAQVVETNLRASHWVSQAIARELGSARHMVELAAASTFIADYIQDGDQFGLQEYVDFQNEQNPSLFSWGIAGADGFILARSPRDDTLKGKSFKFRDWFSGGDPEELPIRQTHVSEPFISKARGNREIVAVSTPVWKAHGGSQDLEVLGILYGTLTLQQLANWVQQAPSSSGESWDGDSSLGLKVVVINQRGQLVIHPNNPLFETQEPSQWEPTQLVQNPGKTRELVDPLQGESPSLFGSTPIDELGWTVVVLRDKADAEKPVQRLINVVTKVRVVVLALGAIVLSVVSVWTVIVMRQRFRGARTA